MGIFSENKDEAFSTFVKWKTMIEKQTEKKVKSFKTDNGLEFCNREFDAFYNNEGIVRHRTCIRAPQENGIAERMNRTLCDKVRSMLLHSGLGKDFWAESMSLLHWIVKGKSQ